jgi:hypothetical protein
MQKLGQPTPNLNVWERFNLAHGSIVSKDPIDKQSIAGWMVKGCLFSVFFSTSPHRGLRKKREKEIYHEGLGSA